MSKPRTATARPAASPHRKTARPAASPHRGLAAARKDALRLTLLLRNRKRSEAIRLAETLHRNLERMMA